MLFTGVVAVGQGKSSSFNFGLSNNCQIISFENANLGPKVIFLGSFDFCNII